MKDLQEPFGSALEWEGLQSAKKVTGLKHSGELLSGSATATIERSDTYQIACEVYGVATDFFQPALEFQNLPRKTFSFSGDCPCYAIDLSNCYLRQRDSLSLDHALWRFWTFEELPLEVNLPMLVNGIEILAKAWFTSPYSTSHGNFTPKEQFLNLLKQDFDSIRTKLVTAGGTEPSMQQLKNEKTLEALTKRIQDSFEMGTGAKTRRFFEELGWQPTEKENEALTARGKQIHGHSESENAQELWVLTESLRTLFYKIMLSLLGYSGEYFDYAKNEVQELNSASLR